MKFRTHEEIQTEALAAGKTAAFRYVLGVLEQNDDLVSNALEIVAHCRKHVKRADAEAAANAPAGESATAIASRLSSQIAAAKRNGAKDLGDLVVLELQKQGL